MVDDCSSGVQLLEGPNRSEAMSDDEASVADISGAQPAFEHASVGLLLST